MARSRNIKPSFFTNDELAEIAPLGRILFVGMWTIADYKGEFEWRPKRLKAQLLPYDDCDIKKLAINLDKSRFITFYSDGNKIYVNVANFVKHQNPHPNEKKKGSEIPRFSDEYRQLIDLKSLTINRDKSRQVIDDSITDPADSFIPLTDSLSKSPELEAQDCFVELPTNKYGTEQEVYRVTHSELKEFQETYPAVDVEQQLRSMRGWLKAKPRQRKTLGGMMSFINSWLSKNQNQGGSNETSRPVSDGKPQSNHARVCATLLQQAANGG